MGGKSDGFSLREGGWDITASARLLRLLGDVRSGTVRGCSRFFRAMRAGGASFLLFGPRLSDGTLGYRAVFLKSLDILLRLLFLDELFVVGDAFIRERTLGAIGGFLIDEFLIRERLLVLQFGDVVAHN